MAHPLLDSRDFHTTEKAFKMMREIKGAFQQGQKRIHKLLRLGVIREGLETSSGWGPQGRLLGRTSNTRCCGVFTFRAGEVGGTRRLHGRLGPGLTEAMGYPLRMQT
jgi:hypothetical protein